MKFFCISKKNQLVTKNLLKKSAEEKGYDFIDVDVDNFSIIDQKYKNQEGILYRVTSGSLAKNIELFLLKENNLVTFYKDTKKT